MSRCTRFEDEGLLQLERGEPLDEHFDDCDDCRDARRAYEILARRIGDATPRDSPTPGWQKRVWAEIDQGVQSRRFFRWNWVWTPAVTAAALLVVVLVWLIQDGPGDVQLRVSLVSDSGTVYRGGTVVPGTTMQLQASTGVSAQAELRVYLDDTELVLRCSTEPPCRRTADGIAATLVLEGTGDYQPVLLVSDEPLPDPRRNLDEDAGAVRESGGRFELSRDPVRVH